MTKTIEHLEKNRNKIKSNRKELKSNILSNNLLERKQTKLEENIFVYEISNVFIFGEKKILQVDGRTVVEQFNEYPLI